MKLAKKNNKKIKINSSCTETLLKRKIIKIN